VCPFYKGRTQKLYERKCYGKSSDIKEIKLNIFWCTRHIIISKKYIFIVFISQTFSAKQMGRFQRAFMKG
jgi:hypothetical protein